MDASNLLKPALARAILHCMRHTLDEYRKHVERTPGAGAPVPADLRSEPTVEDTI